MRVTALCRSPAGEPDQVDLCAIRSGSTEVSELTACMLMVLGWPRAPVAKDWCPGQRNAVNDCPPLC
jgi:hypothetical protein